MWFFKGDPEYKAIVNLAFVNKVYSQVLKQIIIFSLLKPFRGKKKRAEFCVILPFLDVVKRCRNPAPHLLVLLQLCVVDLSDLGEFGSVVGMFDGVVGRSARGRGRSCGGCRSSALLRAGYALRQQHVV